MDAYQTAQAYAFSPPTSSIDSEYSDEELTPRAPLIAFKMPGGRHPKTVEKSSSNQPAMRTFLYDPQTKASFHPSFPYQGRLASVSSDETNTDTLTPNFANGGDHLTKLSTQLVCKILSFLPLNDGVCFALAAPRIYVIHRSLRGCSPYVTLHTPDVISGGFPLRWRLREWMKEQGFFYCWESRKFVRQGRGWLREGCRCEEIANGKKFTMEGEVKKDWVSEYLKREGRSFVASG
ncbi:hypothetical protein BJ878DRAFT_542053 [Calycina marina]|uniref:Uncharacterized protein n=1 Tax=Calycina marina TaxID=1763456 RepID=A0A9P7Z3J1_9HELO|nr:hypothetical protein BJ878DRAFT_542053 [Calycina marina]